MEELEDKIKKFHENIDNWIRESKIDYGTDFGDKANDVGQILHYSREELKVMTFPDYQASIFLLNQYLMHLKSIVAREKAVKAWAEQGIWYIVTGVSHDKYAKWEEKYHSAIRNHKSGLKLQMLKTTAEARILAGEATIGSVETAMKVFENMGRNKSYERS